MSFAGFRAPAAWAFLCFGGGGVTAAITGDERVFAIGFGLTVLGVPLLRQIAEFHGYFFVSETSTSAQGTLVTYARRR